METALKKTEGGSLNFSFRETSLVDLLDKIIDKGAFLEGGVLLSLADVDLLFIKLRLVIASTSRQDKGEKKRKAKADKKDALYIKNTKEQIRSIENRINDLTLLESPEKPEKGIAKLVLVLVELIRQLMEKEAIRKIDRQELSDTQIEKIGLSFKALEKKIEEMKRLFGIEEDLNLDLGPLGNAL